MSGEGKGPCPKGGDHDFQWDRNEDGASVLVCSKCGAEERYRP